MEKKMQAYFWSKSRREGITLKISHKWENNIKVNFRSSQGE